MRSLKLFAGPGLLLTAALFVAAGAPEAAAVQQTKTFTITADDLTAAGAEFFDLTFAIGGAQVTVEHTADSAIALQAAVTYDDAGPEPTLDLSPDDITGFIAVLSSGYDASEMNRDIPFPQQWHVVMGSYGVSTDLTVAGGGIKTIMDFGGMPLRNVNLALGGVSAFINFSVPTTRCVENFSVAGGGMAIEIDNIANSDFQRFSFIGGGVLADLDFRGAYASPEHSARIIGAGSRISVEVPDDAGESVSSLSAGGLTFVWGTGWRWFPFFFFYNNYKTIDYTTAAVHLDFDIIAAGALVTVARS